MKYITMCTTTAVFVLLHVSAYAQRDISQAHVDELFETARTAAFQKNYEEARVLLFRILKNHPLHFDASVLLGKIYAWEGKYDSARSFFKNVLMKEPFHYECLQAAIDVERWDGKIQEALRLLENALQRYPTEGDFLIKKAQVLKELHRDDEAQVTLNLLQDLYPSRADVKQLREELAVTTLLQSVGVLYAIDVFDVPTPMHSTYIQYSRRTRPGVFFVRVNTIYRYQQSAFQIETDFYPRIGSYTYLYLNYGYSPDVLYPQHRLGGEVYTSPFDKFEGSLGFRLLHFSLHTNVWIFTTSIGYYWQNFWFSLRPYLSPQNSRILTALSFLSRYYRGSADEYIQWRGGIGFTPDERLLQTQAGEQQKTLFYLKSQSLGVGIQKGIGFRYSVLALLDWTHQEKASQGGKYENMYSFSLSFLWKF